MESTAIPLSLTLKVEESEEQIQGPELEDGSTDMQKVRICSEGAWVSLGSGGHTACAKPPPGADRGRKSSPAQLGCSPSRENRAVALKGAVETEQVT